MKKLIYILMCTASLFMSQSCSKEAPFSGEEETMGQVMTSNLLLEFINEDLQSRLKHRCQPCRLHRGIPQKLGADSLRRIQI